MFNHSCVPNAIVAFPRLSSPPQRQRPVLRISALRQIDPGDEVTIAYVDTLGFARERRAELRHAYFFDCSCASCTVGMDAGEVDKRECFMCRGECTTFSLSGKYLRPRVEVYWELTKGSRR